MGKCTRVDDKTGITRSTAHIHAKLVVVAAAAAAVGHASTVEKLGKAEMRTPLALSMHANSISHNKVDCPNPRQGGGGRPDRTCFNCGQAGHSKADCPNERVMKCRNCDEGKCCIACMLDSQS